MVAAGGDTLLVRSLLKAECRKNCCFSLDIRDVVGCKLKADACAMEENDGDDINRAPLG